MLRSSYHETVRKLVYAHSMPNSLAIELSYSVRSISSVPQVLPARRFPAHRPAPAPDGRAVSVSPHARGVVSWLVSFQVSTPERSHGRSSACPVIGNDRTNIVNCTIFVRFKPSYTQWLVLSPRGGARHAPSVSVTGTRPADRSDDTEQMLHAC